MTDGGNLMGVVTTGAGIMITTGILCHTMRNLDRCYQNTNRNSYRRTTSTRRSTSGRRTSTRRR